MENKPIINSYCAAERLYAGEYPGDRGQEKAKDKLEAFLDFGITHFIDLTEEDVIVEFGNNKNCRIPMKKDSVAQVEKA